MTLRELVSMCNHAIEQAGTDEILVEFVTLGGEFAFSDWWEKSAEGTVQFFSEEELED